jgi:hypothetical protein
MRTESTCSATVDQVPREVGSLRVRHSSCAFSMQQHFVQTGQHAVRLEQQGSLLLDSPFQSIEGQQRVIRGTGYLNGLGVSGESQREKSQVEA